jgi:hypothetical protein
MVEEKVMNKEIIVNSDASYGQAMRLVNDLYLHNKYLTIKLSTGKQRTGQQNNAIHKFCRMIADACNDAGYEYTIKSLLRDKETKKSKAIGMPWTWERVKDVIWLEVQTAMYPEKSRSTTALKSDEVTQVANVIIRHLATDLGLNIPFPSKEEMNGDKT